MACLLSAGITRECNYGFGGIKTNLYLANFSEVSSLQRASDESITGVTMSSTGASWYLYEAETNSAGLSSVLTKNPGSKYVDLSITFKLAGMTQAKKNQIEQLGISKVAAIIRVNDETGTYWYIGDPVKTDGIEATVGSWTTGSAQSDDNVIEITLQGLSAGYADTITAAAVAAAIA